MLLSSLLFGEPKLSEAVNSPVSQGVVEIPFSHLNPLERKKRDPFLQFCISTARCRISSCRTSGYVTAAALDRMFLLESLCPENTHQWQEPRHWREIDFAI